MWKVFNLCKNLFRHAKQMFTTQISVANRNKRGPAHTYVYHFGGKSNFKHTKAHTHTHT